MENRMEGGVNPEMHEQREKLENIFDTWVDNIMKGRLEGSGSVEEIGDHLGDVLDQAAVDAEEARKFISYDENGHPTMVTPEVGQYHDLLDKPHLAELRPFREHIKELVDFMTWKDIPSKAEFVEAILAGRPIVIHNVDAEDDSRLPEYTVDTYVKLRLVGDGLEIEKIYNQFVDEDEWGQRRVEPDDYRLDFQEGRPMDTEWKHGKTVQTLRLGRAGRVGKVLEGEHKKREREVDEFGNETTAA